MLKMNSIYSLLYLFISILVFICDQISKSFFQEQLHLYQQIIIIPEIFSFILVYNTGIAFNFLSDGYLWQKILLYSTTLCSSIILLYLLLFLKYKNILLSVAITFILGGAFGNLYDRIMRGYVIDFILFHWKNAWYFPVFNIADIAITIGSCILIIQIYTKKHDFKN